MERHCSIVLIIMLLASILSASANIRLARASGTIYIRADGSIDPPTAPFYTNDNATYLLTDNITTSDDGIIIERNNTVLDGTGHTIRSEWANNNKGIDTSERNNVTIRNVTIINYAYGVFLSSSSSISVLKSTIIGVGGSWEGFYWGIFMMASWSNNLSENELLSNDQGLHIENSSNNSIFGNRIAYNRWKGVWLSASSNNNVVGNNITNNEDYGLHLENSSNNTIVCNSIMSNTWKGVWLSASSNNNVSKNTFLNDGLVTSRSYANMVENNTVNGKPLVFLEGLSDYIVDGDPGQIVLIECNNIKVEGLNLSRTAAGLLLSGTNNSRIANNSIANSGVGISIEASQNCSIIGNNITGNAYGIQLGCSDSVVLGNTITNSHIISDLEEGSGILILGSRNSITENSIAENRIGIETYFNAQDNAILGNDIDNNTNGMRFWGPSNSVIGNDISGNSMSGIDIAVGTYAHGNVFLENNITLNGRDGIQFQGCFDNYITRNVIMGNGWNGIFLISCSNNSIIANKIAGNGRSGIQLIGNCANTLDDGFISGGNFWGDYNGTDSDHDAIGDSPWTVGPNNTDRYPLMGAYNSFNATLEQTLQIISNSTISRFTFNGTAISFEVSGQTGFAGFCRICIPTTLVNGNYKIFVNGTEIAYTLLPFSNSTNSYLYFSYTHSTQQVIVIPEYPSLTILLLTALPSLTILSAKKRTRKLHV